MGILQIANDIGKSVISKSKDAVKELSNKLKELAKKQSAPLRAILGGVAGILGLGADGLNFKRLIRDEKKDFKMDTFSPASLQK